jgi:hypothetical protein
MLDLICSVLFRTKFAQRLERLLLHFEDWLQIRRSRFGTRFSEAARDEKMADLGWHF